MGLCRRTPCFHSSGIYGALSLSGTVPAAENTVVEETQFPPPWSPQCTDKEPPQRIYDPLLPPCPCPHLLPPILALGSHHGPRSSCLQSVRQNEEHKPEFTTATRQETLMRW